MLRFLASACVLGSLAGCASPPHPTVATHPALPAGERGTIVAMRPVPGHDRRQVSVLLARLGGGASVAGNTEFIVKQEDGRVLAVVQPATQGLQPGQPVLILAGTPPRISPLPSVAER